MMAETQEGELPPQQPSARPDPPPPYYSEPGEPSSRDPLLAPLLAAPQVPPQTPIAGQYIPPGTTPAPGGPTPYGAVDRGQLVLALVPTQLAQNLPILRRVNWMPVPQQTIPGCPPGLEYLTQIDQILIHQLDRRIRNIETENRYQILNTEGQQVYFADEESANCQRQCCGPGRAFSMRITDNCQREVIHLERPMRCYWNCGFSCYCCCAPHTIEVQAPPGTVVGYVRQETLGIIRPWFTIENVEGDTVLRIKGPILGCSCCTDANFEVLSADGQQTVGRVSKRWEGLGELLTGIDNFGIQFPMDLDVKMKAVMLGAVFLIDFMFFERRAEQDVD